MYPSNLGMVDVHPDPLAHLPDTFPTYRASGDMPIHDLCLLLYSKPGLTDSMSWAN